MKQRNINLDVLRCIGVIYIPYTHFFHCINFFMETPVEGTIMYVGVIIKNILMVCVPMYMMLTGYLMNRRTVSLKHYLGISKILTMYALACIPLWIFRTLYYGEVFSLKSIFISFVHFENYCWYIAMYVGLYALMPFLNTMYHGLENKKQKTCLLAVFICFTSLPSFTNLFIPNLIPTHFTSITLITYYLMGAYLRDFADDFKLSAKKYLFIYLLTMFLAGTFVNIGSTGRLYYEAAIFLNWDNFSAVLGTPPLFLAALKADFSKMPNWFKTVINKVSLVSLEMFVVSYAFDMMLYDKVLTYGLDRLQLLLLSPVFVAIVLICSFLTSYPLHLIHTYIKKITSGP